MVMISIDGQIISVVKYPTMTLKIIIAGMLAA
jgi:hypothetical protein